MWEGRSAVADTCAENDHMYTYTRINISHSDHVYACDQHLIIIGGSHTTL